MVYYPCTGICAWRGRLRRGWGNACTGVERLPAAQACKHFVSGSGSTVMGQRRLGIGESGTRRSAVEMGQSQLRNGEIGTWMKEQTVKDREIEWSGDAPSLESLRQLRLTALLADVMEELGQVRAARKLGVDRKTLWRCRNSGRLTPRLSDALERMLLEQDLSAAMRQGERVVELERQVAELQGELRAVREAVEGRDDVLGEEHAVAMRKFERRLARLESTAGAEAESKTAAVPDDRPGAEPFRRIYRDLVTEEAEPGEERVYGEAAPVVVDWREAKAAYRHAVEKGTALQRADATIRVLELEIELIEGHELTLPPRTYPWDMSERLDEVWGRRHSLDMAHVHRNRALLRRWLLRVLTCGLWRK